MSILDRDYGVDCVRYRLRTGRRQIDQLLARGGTAEVGGRPLKEMADELWPRGAWAGPQFSGRDGVLDPPGGEHGR